MEGKPSVREAASVDIQGGEAIVEHELRQPEASVEKPVIPTWESREADEKAIMELRERLAHKSEGVSPEERSELDRLREARDAQLETFQKGPVTEAKKIFGGMGRSFEWSNEYGEFGEREGIKDKETLVNKIDKTLISQKEKDDDNRKLGTKIALGTSAGASLAAFAGSVASVGLPTAAAFAGLGLVGIGAPLTLGVWGGMKLWHGFKERRAHNKRDTFVSKLS
ncbi:MAG: hypothetical protein NUV90_02835 [Candidatus Parcubacteria bacterium]|nr:hypothetical protein [Candidatus Parcubacteria bacterium]